MAKSLSHLADFLLSEFNISVPNQANLEEETKILDLVWLTLISRQSKLAPENEPNTDQKKFSK